MIKSYFITVGLALSAAGAWSADVKYPGVAPGPAHVLITNDTVALSNNVILAAWTLTEHGISQRFFRDVSGQRSLTLTGEVFQIVLTNGVRYAASRLVPDGKPRLLSLTPNPKAARLAARLTGRSVEVPLRSADGRLGVVWRALILDGANYVRQEIEATALKEELPLRGIVFDSLTITSRAGFQSTFARDLVLRDASLFVEQGPVLSFRQSTEVTVTGLSYRAGGDLLLQVLGERSRAIRLITVDPTGAQQRLQLGEGVALDAVEWQK